MEIKQIADSFDDFATKTGATLDALQSDMTSLNGKTGDISARLMELEQLASRRRGPEGALGPRPQLAQEIESSGAFKAFIERHSKDASVPVKAKSLLAERKNTIINDGTVLAPATRPAEPYAFPSQRTWLRSLLPGLTVSSGEIEYVRESLFVNNADAQATEGAEKPESDIEFELASMKVSTIAHWVKASRQSLSDSEWLTSFLNKRLTYGLELKLEDQLINGDGTDGTIKGLLATGNHVAFSGGQTTDTLVDLLRRAIGQVENNDYTPSVMILHPNDWTEIELMKDNEERYLIGNPKGQGGSNVWSTPVYRSKAMPEGTFIVADLTQAATFWLREDATVLLGYDGDDFKKNLVTVLGELRAALTVQLPAGIVVGTFF